MASIAARTRSEGRLGLGLPDAHAQSARSGGSPRSRRQAWSPPARPANTVKYGITSPEPGGAEDSVVGVTQCHRRPAVEAQGARDRLDQADLLGVEARRGRAWPARPGGPAPGRRPVGAGPRGRAAPGRAAPPRAAAPTARRDGGRSWRRWRPDRGSDRTVRSTYHRIRLSRSRPSARGSSQIQHTYCTSVSNRSRRKA